MLRYRIVVTRYNELIICTNYAFDSRFMVRDCELQQVIGEAMNYHNFKSTTAIIRRIRFR